MSKRKYSKFALNDHASSQLANMAAAAGGSMPPKDGNNGDPGKKPPTDKADRPRKSAQGNSKGGQRRAYASDEEQCGRNFILANHDNGTFPTRDHTWRNLQDAVNEHNVGKTYTNADGQQVIREERTYAAILQHFRHWWRAYTAEHALTNANESPVCNSLSSL